MRFYFQTIMTLLLALSLFVGCETTKNIKESITSKVDSMTSDVDKDLIDPISVINDTLNNKDIVVIGSQTYNFAVAYKRTMSDGTSLEFQPVQDGLPIVMIDSEGTSWNIMGRAVSGPRAGTQLSRLNQFVGYWFAWAAFYPDIELYQSE